jgi:hypothetical protein
MTLEASNDSGNLAGLKSVPRRSVSARKSHGRSRVSNGRDILPAVDGRSIVARRYRDIAAAILIDQGGLDQCSESGLQLIRRFAACCCLAEELESKLANGQEISVERHALLCSTLTRLASKLGLERRAKDISPTLSDYFRKSSP